MEDNLPVGILRLVLLRTFIHLCYVLLHYSATSQIGSIHNC